MDYGTQKHSLCICQKTNAWGQNEGQETLGGPLAISAARCRSLVAGFSPYRTGFNPRPVRGVFMLDEVAPWLVFLRLLQFSPVSVFPPKLHINSFPHSFIHSFIHSSVHPSVHLITNTVSLAQQANAADSHPLFWFLDHAQFHATVCWTSLDEVSTRRRLPDTTQHSQKTDKHAPGGIRTRNPSNRSAADPRLRTLGHVFLWHSFYCYLYIYA
jgi:hypothetical protein